MPPEEHLVRIPPEVAAALNGISENYGLDPSAFLKDFFETGLGAYLSEDKITELSDGLSNLTLISTSEFTKSQKIQHSDNDY